MLIRVTDPSAGTSSKSRLYFRKALDSIFVQPLLHPLRVPVLARRFVRAQMASCKERILAALPQWELETWVLLTEADDVVQGLGL